MQYIALVHVSFSSRRKILLMIPLPNNGGASNKRCFVFPLTTAGKFYMKMGLLRALCSLAPGVCQRLVLRYLGGEKEVEMMEGEEMISWK